MPAPIDTVVCLPHRCASVLGTASKEPLQNLSPCHSDDRREEESGTIKRTRFFTSSRMTLLQRSTKRISPDSWGPPTLPPSPRRSGERCTPRSGMRSASPPLAPPPHFHGEGEEHIACHMTHPLSGISPTIRTDPPKLASSLPWKRRKNSASRGGSMIHTCLRKPGSLNYPKRIPDWFNA